MKRQAPPERSRRVRIWLDRASNPCGWELEWWEGDRMVGHLQGGCEPFSSEGEILLALASAPSSSRAKDFAGSFLDGSIPQGVAVKRHKYELSGWTYEQFQLELELEEGA